MLIGELAERTGVTAKTLRFYEREGLLHEPDRTSGGYRDFDPIAEDRVGFIREAQGAGFTLRQIRQVLDIRDAGQAPCEHVSILIDRRLSEVEDRLRELRRLRGQLRSLADRAERLDEADRDGFCHIIEAGDEGATT